jgi:hypothetical protein
MPPLQALLALHGLWCLVLFPLVVAAIRFWPARRLRLATRLATPVAVIVLAVLIGVQMLTWFPSVRSDDRRYLPQRIAYVIATSPEVPIVQSLLALAACWFTGRRRRSADAPATDRVTNFARIGCKESNVSPTNE